MTEIRSAPPKKQIAPVKIQETSEKHPQPGGRRRVLKKVSLSALLSPATASSFASLCAIN